MSYKLVTTHTSKSNLKELLRPCIQIRAHLVQLYAYEFL